MTDNNINNNKNNENQQTMKNNALRWIFVENVESDRRLFWKLSSGKWMHFDEWVGHPVMLSMILKFFLCLFYSY